MVAKRAVRGGSDPARVRTRTSPATPAISIGSEVTAAKKYMVGRLIAGRNRYATRAEPDRPTS
ncbi:hypothetical protein JCM9534A_54850 [Catenuloplanes indicus JCM 9534]